LLWEDEAGQLIGFADSDAHGFFEVLIVPDDLGAERHAQIFDEMEVRPREPIGDPPIEAGHRTYAAEDNPAFIAFLETRGYSRSDFFKVQMLRSLAEPVEEAALPEGFEVRPPANGEEEERRVALHNAVFGNVLVERYRRVTRFCTYRRDLDLVAVAPDGTFAASCLLWYDERARMAQIEPVGTLASFRRQGLGRSVILEGLRRARDRGAEVGYVRPQDPEEGLVRFYESCGFRVSRRDYIYFKPEGSGVRQG
jgi:ribosomal protein S18 acetylase RimI-like enzyme